jgi:formylmethanofuran dehydrogenase subunit C
MSTLCLTLRHPPAQRVDLAPLTARPLTGRSRDELAAIELVAGNQRVTLGSLFTLEGETGGDIELRNCCSRLDGIGTGLGEGRLLVYGDAGAYLGRNMTGGTILAAGSVGAYAGTGMTGGVIQVGGDAGDFAGGAVPGDHHGMRGGTLLICGNAGDRAGDRMRRGNLLIEGNAGDYLASRMIAGTVAVLGNVGRLPGYAMRRGTILLLAPTALPATFNNCGVYPLTFLTLLMRSWRNLPGRFASLPDSTRVQRFMGDIANNGRGEILLLQ